jgi:hypothetical protein
VLRLAADENLSGRIARGLRRRVPGLDLVRVQDAGLLGAGDAAGVLLTQDPYYGPGRRLPVAEFDRLWRTSPALRPLPPCPKACGVLSPSPNLEVCAG